MRDKGAEFFEFDSKRTVLNGVRDLEHVASD